MVSILITANIPLFLKAKGYTPFVLLLFLSLRP